MGPLVLRKANTFSITVSTWWIFEQNNSEILKNTATAVSNLKISITFCLTTSSFAIYRILYNEICKKTGFLSSIQWISEPLLHRPARSSPRSDSGLPPTDAHLSSAGSNLQTTHFLQSLPIVVRPRWRNAGALAATGWHLSAACGIWNQQAPTTQALHLRESSEVAAGCFHNSALLPPPESSPCSQDENGKI